MKRNVQVIISLLFVLVFTVVGLQFSVQKPQTVNAETQADLNFNVKSYCLLDAGSGKVLASSKEQEKYEIASMVKLMTSLLTMEKIEKGEWTLDTRLAASEYATSMYGSQAFLDANDEYSVGELLKSVIVASANDSSVVLAEGYAGTEENFVNVMNEKAKTLGLENTLYANCTGLPALSQYSTAKDVALLLREVAKHDLYHTYSKIWMDKLVHKSGRETELVNTNRLIKYYPGCDIGKTGFTDEAGYCLSASALKNNMRLVAVVMGAKTSEDRFSTTASLLNYGFGNFENKMVLSSGESFASSIKIKGIKDEIKVHSQKDLTVMTKRGDQEHKFETLVKCDKNIKSPIEKDKVVGTVYLVEDGVVIDETKLMASESYKKSTYGETVKHVAGKWRF